MAQSDMQRGTLKSEELFFDSEASLLDQQDFDMPSCPYNDVFNSKDSHMEQITFLKNVQVLLEAAQFLESAERKDGSEFFAAYICVAAFDPLSFASEFQENKTFIVNSLRQQRAELIQLSTATC